MKIQNIKNVEAFLAMIDKCHGKVELVTSEGDRLNLKSKLCQYVAFATMFQNKEIEEMEIVAYETEDTLAILDFMSEQLFLKKQRQVSMKIWEIPIRMCPRLQMLPRNFPKKQRAFISPQKP